MKRLLVLSAFLAACGSVVERGDCSASTDCPAGEWCAPAGDGRVCWPDAVPPEVTSVSAACEGPCRRDSTLRVTATVTDAAGEVLDASVTLDLGGEPVPLARSGDEWVADVDLRTRPFEHFQHAVVATVTARDGARNASAPVPAAGVEVTRLKWTYDAGAPITSPAVMEDGTVVVGRSATSEQLLAVRADGTKAWSLTVGGTSFVTAAPAIGDHAIWVGSEDFSLYAVELDGSAVRPNVGVNVGGPVRGSLAVLPTSAKEWAFATAAAGDGTGFIGISSSAPNEKNVTAAPFQEGFTAGPVIGLDDRIHAPTATATNAATLRSYQLSVSPVVLTSSWTASIGTKSSAPISVDALGRLVSASDGLPPMLNRTVTGAVPSTVKLGDASGVIGDATVILANGDVVVGDESGAMHWFTPTGPAWSSPPNLGAPVRAPIALTQTTARFVIPTNAGTIHALSDDGVVNWQGTLPAGTGLRAANIFTPASQPAGQPLSVAYFASATGRLFAVIVDGRLDEAAPWPKAFHDPRNTNRAGPQP